MQTTLKQKALASFLGIIIAIALFFSPVTRIPFLDTKTDSYFSNSITKAGLAYATCRAINASVSIIKESSLQLEPAGVGVSLAVGQILDPVDDMTERVSDVLVTAITSLGVQKLIFEISVSLAPQIFAIFLFILSILIWFENEGLTSLQKITARFLILIAVLRLCLPLSSLANEYIYNNYFADQISHANNELKLHSVKFDQLGDVTLPESSGFFETIEKSGSFIKKKSVEFKNALKDSVSSMENIIENLLKLTFLYVGIFVIQVIFLPVLIFWFVIKIANTLFHTNLTVKLSDNELINNQ